VGIGMSKDIFFLSGLPRTGSTLLSSILSQNLNIHTEGNSALCQLMWDMQVSCETTEQMRNKPGLQHKLISEIPNMFYENASGHIIDKCRSWTMPANLDLIEKYITKTPKIIVMVRPIIDIVKSFVFIRQMNNWEDPEVGLLDINSEPIMRSLFGVINAKQINTGQFLFIEYEDLINNTKNTLNNVYNFLGLPIYEHDLDNIVNPNLEADDELNMIGLHDIRSKITRRSVSVKLSKELESKAIELQKLLEGKI
jgi:sulfotransferase